MNLRKIAQKSVALIVTAMLFVTALLPAAPFVLSAKAAGLTDSVTIDFKRYESKPAGKNGRVKFHIKTYDLAENPLSILSKDKIAADTETEAGNNVIWLAKIKAAGNGVIYYGSDFSKRYRGSGWTIALDRAVIKKTVPTGAGTEIPFGGVRTDDNATDVAGSIVILNEDGTENQHVAITEDTEFEIKLYYDTNVTKKTGMYWVNERGEKLELDGSLTFGAGQVTIEARGNAPETRTGADVELALNDSTLAPPTISKTDPISGKEIIYYYTGTVYTAGDNPNIPATRKFGTTEDEIYHHLNQNFNNTPKGDISIRQVTRLTANSEEIVFYDDNARQSGGQLKKQATVTDAVLFHKRSLNVNNHDTGVEHTLSLSGKSDAGNLVFCYTSKMEGKFQFDPSKVVLPAVDIAREKFVDQDPEGTGDKTHYDLNLTIQSKNLQKNAQPVDMLFVLDASGSMTFRMDSSDQTATGTERSRMNELHDAVIGLVKELNQMEADGNLDMQYAAVYFGTFAGEGNGRPNSYSVYKNEEEANGSRVWKKWTDAELNTIIRNTATGGEGTNYQSALREAKKIFKENESRNARKVLVFVTDGLPTQSLSIVPAGGGNSMGYTEQIREDIIQELQTLTVDEFYAIGINTTHYRGALHYKNIPLITWHNNYWAERSPLATKFEWAVGGNQGLHSTSHYLEELVSHVNVTDPVNNPPTVQTAENSTQLKEAFAKIAAKDFGNQYGVFDIYDTLSEFADVRIGEVQNGTPLAAKLAITATKYDTTTYTQTGEVQSAVVYSNYPGKPAETLPDNQINKNNTVTLQFYDTDEDPGKTKPYTLTASINTTRNPDGSRSTDYGKLHLDFGDDYILNPAYEFRISLAIEPSEEAYRTYAVNAHKLMINDDLYDGGVTTSTYQIDYAVNNTKIAKGDNYDQNALKPGDQKTGTHAGDAGFWSNAEDVDAAGVQKIRQETEKDSSGRPKKDPITNEYIWKNVQARDMDGNLIFDILGDPVWDTRTTAIATFKQHIEAGFGTAQDDQQGEVFYARPVIQVEDKEVEIVKLWNEEDGYVEKRPKSVKFLIFERARDGRDIPVRDAKGNDIYPNGITLTAADADPLNPNKWVGVFEHLPKTRDADVFGNKETVPYVVYEVVSDVRPAYSHNAESYTLIYDDTKKRYDIASALPGDDWKWSRDIPGTARFEMTNTLNVSHLTVDKEITGLSAGETPDNQPFEFTLEEWDATAAGGGKWVGVVSEEIDPVTLQPVPGKKYRLYEIDPATKNATLVPEPAPGAHRTSAEGKFTITATQKADFTFYAEQGKILRVTETDPFLQKDAGGNPVVHPYTYYKDPVYLYTRTETDHHKNVTGTTTESNVTQATTANVLPVNGTIDVVVTNTVDKREAKIEKEVTGDLGEKDHDFIFRAQIRNQGGAALAEYDLNKIRFYRKNRNGSETEITSEVVTKLKESGANDTYEFKLKHEEYLLVRYMPRNAEFTVTEVRSSDLIAKAHATSGKVSYTQDGSAENVGSAVAIGGGDYSTGVVKASDTALKLHIIVTNHQQSSPPPEASKSTSTFTPTSATPVTRLGVALSGNRDNIRTSDLMQYAAYGVTLLLSVFGILVMILRNRRRY